MNDYLAKARPYISDFNSLTSYTMRHPLITRYAWAIPDETALATIAKYGPIVEIGAGRGYWASLLAERGVDIVAFDKEYQEHGFFKVQPGFANKASEYPDRALFLCWPPYDDPMAADCLKHYKGSTIIYVGESWVAALVVQHFTRCLTRTGSVSKRSISPSGPASTIT